MNHIQYYHMDALRSIQLGHSYFMSHLVVNTWIPITLSHLDQIFLTRSSNSAREYFDCSSLPLYLAVLSIFTNVVINVFPIV